jgi:hypothetical protein
MPFVQEVLRKPFDLLVFAALVRRLVAQGEQSSPAAESAATEEQGGLRKALPRENRSDSRSDSRKDGPGDRGIAVEY